MEEHPYHGSDVADLPTTDRRRVQRLVERSGVSEHEAHILDLVDPPVVQRLVKMGVVEHHPHRRDGGGVPIADILVEVGEGEHGIHILDAGHIPVVQI